MDEEDRHNLERRSSRDENIAGTEQATGNSMIDYEFGKDDTALVLLGMNRRRSTSNVRQENEKSTEENCGTVHRRSLKGSGTQMTVQEEGVEVLSVNLSGQHNRPDEQVLIDRSANVRAIEERGDENEIEREVRVPAAASNDDSDHVRKGKETTNVDMASNARKKTTNGTKQCSKSKSKLTTTKPGRKKKGTRKMTNDRRRNSSSNGRQDDERSGELVVETIDSDKEDDEEGDDSLGHWSDEEVMNLVRVWAAVTKQSSQSEIQFWQSVCDYVRKHYKSD